MYLDCQQRWLLGLRWASSTMVFVRCLLVGGAQVAQDGVAVLGGQQVVPLGPLLSVSFLFFSELQRCFVLLALLCFAPPWLLRLKQHTCAKCCHHSATPHMHCRAQCCRRHWPRNALTLVIGLQRGASRVVGAMSLHVFSSTGKMS
jgi:hypothetical protein